MSRKVLTQRELQVKAVKEAVERRKMKEIYEANRGSSASEYESYYEEDEGDSPNSFDQEEEDYLQFLEEWGHVDFTYLTFLPDIRTVDELIELRERDRLNTTTAIRTQTLIAQNPKRPQKRDRRQKKDAEQKEKKITLYEKQYGKSQVDGGDELTLG